MTQASEGATVMPETGDHDAMLAALRELAREENGIRKWLAGLAALVAAAAILGSFAVWRTQGQIVVRLDRVEVDVAEIRGDVKTLLRGER